ncbi:MAG: hypothetical protein ACM31C_05205, partial [Acidobacteriota bacterium]
MKTALLLACLAGACGKSSTTSSSPSAPPPAGNTAGNTAMVDGTWKGTWTRTEPANMPGGGDFMLDVRDGKAMLTVTGSLCFQQPVPIAITVKGNSVTMDVHAPPITASYQGTRAGDEMSGTLTVTCAPGTGK